MAEAEQMKMLPLFALVMDESAIVEHKLRIPTKSAMIFHEELSDLATLTVPNSHRPWHVKLEKNGVNGIWLNDGLQEFINYYSIHSGCILQFVYKRNSVFSVHICDAFGSEIDYPIYGPKIEENNEKDISNDDCRVEIFDSKQPMFHGSFCKQEGDTRDDDHLVENLDVRPPIFHGSSERKALSGGLKQKYPGISTQIVLNQRERGRVRKQRRNAVSMDHRGPSDFWYRTRSISRIKEEEEKAQELGNANISGISKPKENNNKSRPHDLPVKRENNNEMIVPRSFSYDKSRRPVLSTETEKAVRAAFRCNLRNPSFMIIVKTYSIYMDVPAEFVRRHMKWSSEMIQLQVHNERKKWPVRCYYKSRNSSCTVKKMGEGWGPFSTSKNLQGGDVCVFELISKVNGILLRVWIYYASDYEEAPRKHLKAE
ncbi:B3 DNA binding domain containing protein [Parasponia andersonii]|uniref:B3 DNA binding domain containing protein n=1 Tax=Parasponia andersonii TaxID=3476 RepID=A0A2P5CH81_PARAD|nr:B3 DNA binding domain containing protein [Parasponia andersonii]